MIKNILCPVDLSKSSIRARRWAVKVASKLEARLLFLHVLDTSRFSREGMSIPGDFLEELRHRVENELSDLAGSSEGDVHVDVAEGDPYTTILERTGRLNVDLLVMSSRGHSGIGRILNGSLTERILEHVAIPVLVVPDDLKEGSDPEPTLRTVLMAIDFGIDTTTVIHSAFELAGLWKAKLLALHVVAPPREVFVDKDGSCWMSDEMLQQLEGKLKDVRRKQMASLFRQLHLDASDVELIATEGEAHEMICSIASKRHVDLVLLGLHRHHMRPLGWIGSTCHRTVQLGCCPTWIVKTVWHGNHDSHNRSRTMFESMRIGKNQT